MAFPTYIGKGTFQSTIAAAGTTPSLPASIQTGDLLIAVVSTPNDTTLSSASSDWTLLARRGDGTVATAGAVDVSVWYAIYNGVALGAFSTTNQRLKCQQVYAFRNAAIPAVFATGLQTTAATAWTLPSITTSYADSFVFFAIGNDRDTDSTTNVSGYTNSNLANITEIHDEVVSTGVGGGIATVYAEKATAGSTGTTSATSAASNTAAFITFAISTPLSITADGGTYAYTGTAANTLYNRRVAADPASLTYSGNNAGLLFNRKVIAEVGGYTYSGNNAGLLNNRNLVADAGTYTYSGDNASLVYGTVGAFTLTANTGSFSYSGNTANLVAGRKVVADTGAFSYSGNNANLLSGKRIVADVGTFTYAGNSANLLSGRKVIAATGSYSYSGNAASVLYNRKVIADAGSYSYSGNAASVLYNRKLAADTGSFSYSGGSATLTFGSGISKIYLGTFNLVNLKFGTRPVYEAFLGTTQVWGTTRPANTLTAETGMYAYSGNNSTLRYGKALAAGTATYTLTGSANALRYSRRMIADSATYTLTGSAATLIKAYTMTRYALINDDNLSGASSITAVFNTNGTISFNISSGDGPVDTDFTHWHDGGTVSGIGNSRWAKRTLLSGDAVTGTLDTTIVALSASKTIAIQTVAGEAKSGEVLVEIYSDAGGITKVGQITLTITALV
jgi:hypothetical protein